MNAHAVPPVPPPIADITFRLWRGLEELPGMLAALLAAAAHDDLQRHDTLEALIMTYTHLDNCDPATDLLIAELDGVTVAYLRSGRPVDVHARARISKAGRTVAHVLAEAWQDDETQPIAALTAHFLMAEDDS